jgi:hypothetical protein
MDPPNAMIKYYLVIISPVLHKLRFVSIARSMYLFLVNYYYYLSY